MTKITIRSYNLIQLIAGGRNFEDVLNQISQLSPRGRDKMLTDDCTVSLARYERLNNADIITGEFIRVRDTNFPFALNNQGNGINGLLLQDSNIGYGAAFRYRTTDKRLYIQYDARIVSAGRAIGYVNESINSKQFFAEVRISNDAWQRFNDSDLRKVKIGIASRDNFTSAPVIGSAARFFAETAPNLGAASISLEIGMGQKKGNLLDRAKQEMRDVLQYSEDESLKLNSLKATGRGASDESIKDINLLDDILFVKKDITFPKDNPDENYRLRKELLEEMMGNNEL